ncbi:MAG: Dipeptidyl aminopeptidase BIII [Phycisphaerales bacterium]|nr:Dipeptidyl aminopeptidase BIII [Phycisphaerales bacterium]
MSPARTLVLSSLAVLLAAPGTWAQPAPSPTPAAQSATTPSIERFLKIRTPTRPTVLPDGSLYVVDWPDGVNQLYRSRTGTADASAGGLERVSDFRDGISGYSVAPNGSRVLMTAAVGGNENTQIYMVGPAGETIAITDNPKVQHAVTSWVHDSSGFYYSANDTSPNDFYLYRYDFAAPGQTGKTTRILAKEGSWSVQDATEDGSMLLVQQYKSASDTTVYLLDAASGELKELPIEIPGAQPGTRANDAVGFLPGEKQVLMLSDIADGRRQLYVKDLASGAVTQPISRLGNFEVDSASISHEKDLLAVVTNEDGYGVLHLFKVPEFSAIVLPPIEKGVVSLSDLRNRTITWTLSNARSANVAYSYTVPTQVGERARVQATQRTFTDTQGIDLKTFQLPELVRYKSFDGLEIPAFVFLPKGAAKGTPVPFVVNYHGGPEGQHRPSFSAVIQYLVAEGYGVMMPNVRGSTGYGRSFQMLDDYKNRWNSVKDGVEAARWLIGEGYAAPGKIATYGGSYGGFMSVACLVEDQNSGKPVFGAGIDIVGIVNFQTFLERTAGYRRKLREVEYGPLTDPEFLTSISPLRQVEKIKVPMFIAHGFNDPRVPIDEAVQLAMALRAQAKDNPALMPQLMVFPDEGHGFAKLDNRLLYYDRMVRFLDQHIAGN